MENSIINDLLYKVKENKKYRGVADEIIIGEINNYLNTNKISKIKKQDVKNIRNILHKSYVSFQTKKKNKISIYLKELKDDINDTEKLKEITERLLSSVLSTKERLNDYENIYKKIFEISIIPKSIIDLGAGFNLFSYPLMNLRNLEYYSYDINNEDIKYLNDYIKIMKIKGLSGNAKILNLRNIKHLSNIPDSDMVFLFKIIDILDKTSHKPSEDLIKILIKKTKYIIASFATKTLTRKNMNNPNRLWFELMLKRNNLNFNKFETDSEVFYIIKTN